MLKNLDKLKISYMNFNSKMIDFLIANPFIYRAELVDSTPKPYPVNSVQIHRIIYCFYFPA
jgi:hypothetical protein